MPRITALPALSTPILGTFLFPVVNETNSPVDTEKATMADLVAFLQANYPMLYDCLANPNTETISAFKGSVAFGDDGSVWKQMTAGVSNSGWQKVISA